MRPHGLSAQTRDHNEIRRGNGRSCREVSGAQSAAQRVADRHGERIRGVMRRRRLFQPQDRHHHPLHLRLLGPAVAADRLLHVRGRVLNALDAERRGRDEHGAAGLTHGERGAGVDADEGLLDGDRIGSNCSIRSMTPSKIVLRRSSGRCLAEVCHHPNSTALRRFPFPWTMPNPQAAVPGSMPRTVTSTH